MYNHCICLKSRGYSREFLVSWLEKAIYLCTQVRVREEPLSGPGDTSTYPQRPSTIRWEDVLINPSHNLESEEGKEKELKSAPYNLSRDCGTFPYASEDRLPVQFFVNYPTDREGLHIGISFVYISNKQVVNLLLGLRPNGEEISVCLTDSSDWADIVAGQPLVDLDSIPRDTVVHGREMPRSSCGERSSSPCTNAWQRDCVSSRDFRNMKAVASPLGKQTGSKKIRVDRVAIRQTTSEILTTRFVDVAALKQYLWFLFRDNEPHVHKMYMLKGTLYLVFANALDCSLALNLIRKVSIREGVLILFREGGTQ